MTNSKGATLVLRGSGRTGSRVAQNLIERGLSARTAARGDAHVRFDWDDKTTHGPALSGVDSVYLVTPVMRVDFAGQVSDFLDLAEAAGVRHVTYLSTYGIDQASPEFAIRAVELDLLSRTGLTHSILRPAWVMQNFSESFWLDPLLGGELVLPAGDVPVPFVDAEDIAAVAVAALTEDGHAGEVYELSGPRALTFAEAVAEIAAASGRELRYVPVSAGEYAAAAIAEGTPAEIVDLLGYLFAEVLVEANAYLGDGTRRALGRPALDFAVFAREAAAAGVWSPLDAGARIHDREAA